MNDNYTRSFSLECDKEKCNECNLNLVFISCNKCASGLCLNNSCCWEFPHYYNTQYYICNSCYTYIDNKLINYDQLLIYNFIKQNTIIKRRHSC